ncbi:transposase [Streptomyces sp. NBC_01216]|nr:transposase [Streptomyces sp. NBC_01216]
MHIDPLFGEPGKNVIDFDLIESQFRHLMRVAVSVREGAISSSTLLKRLRSGSRKNATYAAFREVGRVIRTVQLLRYLADAPLRRRVTAATNKVESFNRFSQWIGFGNRGVIADNEDRPGGPGAHLAVPDRAHQPVRRVQHARARHPARRVRPKARRRLHPAARAGPDHRRPRPSRVSLAIQ